MTDVQDTILRPVFTIRLDSQDSTRDVAAAVSNALSLKLEPTRVVRGGAEVHSVEAMGLLLELVAWPPWPVDGIHTYQLQGVPVGITYSDQDQKADISRHVVDVLGLKGAGTWYIPSLEQVLRELDLGEELDSDA